jgi:hypothetical protein
LIQFCWLVPVAQFAPLSVGVVVVCAAAGQAHTPAMRATAAEPTRPFRIDLTVLISCSLH